MKTNNQKNITKLTYVAIAVIVLGVLAGIFHTLAFTGPSKNAGSGSGALGVDSSGNISVGTSTTQSNTKLFVLGSTTNSSAYGLQVWNSARNNLLYVRNDGFVYIPGAAEIDGVLTATLNASNISAGQFGAGDFSFQGAITATGGITATNGYVTTNEGFIIGPRSGSGNWQWYAANGDVWLYEGAAGIDRITMLPGGNMGIGTESPKNDLDVSGNMAVGSYAGSNAAPLNGMIISGNVGIGTLSPAVKLDVVGAIYGENSESHFWNGTYADPDSGTAHAIKIGAGGIAVNGNSVFNNNVGIGTTGPASLLSVGGAGLANTGISSYGSDYGVYGNSTNGIGVYGYTTTINGIGTKGWGNNSTNGIGVYGSGGTVGVYGYGSVYGGQFSGSTYGVYTNSCSGCSVLAEMAPVSEVPNNGDVMCTNPNNGNTEICKEDKSDYIKGIAQKFAENIMRMGCNDTLDPKNGTNGQTLGVMNVDAWSKNPECQGWYPIALSGLSEQTNVVCKSPEGKILGYGDILVSSNIPGRLRPLDQDEDVKSYQIVGKADSICAPGKGMDSIKVWIQ